jgi:hypothetical protein
VPTNSIFYLLSINGAVHVRSAWPHDHPKGVLHTVLFAHTVLHLLMRGTFRLDPRLRFQPLPPWDGANTGGDLAEGLLLLQFSSLLWLLDPS